MNEMEAAFWPCIVVIVVRLILACARAVLNSRLAKGELATRTTRPPPGEWRNL